MEQQYQNTALVVLNYIYGEHWALTASAKLLSEGYRETAQGKHSDEQGNIFKDCLKKNKEEQCSSAMCFMPKY